MTIYTFPASLWSCSSASVSLLARSTSTPQSAFNPLLFQDGPTTELWIASVTITPQKPADWREVSALIRKLRGRRNKVRLFDPYRPLRGAGAAGPTINIAADAPAGSTTISVSGLTPSQAVAVAADDLLGVGENLFANNDDAPSDSSGNATLHILPPLRVGVAEGDPVTLPSRDIASISAPTGLFMLTNGGAHVIVPGQISQPLSLEFAEAPDFD